MPARIPIHIIGGFLGVGKTTTLLQLVASRKGTERAAVVVNDFGEAAIDAGRISGADPTDSGPALRVENIPGGCVCCTAPEGLVKVIGELLDIDKPDRIYIEPSGLGRPRDVVDMLARGGIAARVDLRPVVVVVDPERLDLEDPLMQEQWEGGDVLVVNRIDLASREKLERLRAAVRSKWPPFLQVIETSHGVLPAGLPDWRRTDPSRREHAGHEHAEHAEHAGHEHAGHEHADSTTGFMARSSIFSPEATFAWDALRRLLGAPEIARFKGMFRTDLGWLKVDVAGGRVEMRGSPWRRDSRYDAVVHQEHGAFLAGLEVGISGAQIPEVQQGQPVVALVDRDGNSMELTRDSFARLGAVDVAPRVPGRSGTAVLLRDVLQLLSPPADARVVLCSADGLIADPVGVHEIGEALLVYGLEGHALPDNAGGPFRVLVPSTLSACASVKALSRIRLL